MEFCAEIAVLESAFQLTEQKVVSSFADLPKQSCFEAAHVVQVAVEEICAGLEQDNEPEERMLWNQKCHTIILYRLITAKYNKTEQKLPEGCVPRLSTLDTLSHAIPAFSIHFYFEIVKQCGWQQMFVDSLFYLDPTLAVQLLQEAVHHCQLVPCTQSDTQLITTVMENLVTSLLQCPPPTNIALQTLCSAVCKPTSFIQTVYPESCLNGTDPNQNIDNTQNNSSNISENFDGTFWCIFLTENPDFLTYGLDCCSQFCSDNETALDKESDENEQAVPEVNELGDFKLAQLLFLWYVAQLSPGLFMNHLSQPGTPGWDKWFTYNIRVQPTDEEVATGSAAHTLNYALLDCISERCPKGQLLVCIHKCLLHIQSNIKTFTEHSAFTEHKTFSEHKVHPTDVHVNSNIADSEMIKEKTNTVDNNLELDENSIQNTKNSANLQEDKGMVTDPAMCLDKAHNWTMRNRETSLFSVCTDVCIVRNIMVRSNVLLRMFIGTLSCIEHSSTVDECTQIAQRMLADVRTAVRVGQDIGVTIAVDDGVVDTAEADREVLLEDSWDKDVSLPVLLWRISSDQPQSEACLEELLSERCNLFWCYNSVYKVLGKIKPTLWTTRRVLQLFHIAEFVEKNASRETTQKIKDLILVVFSELPFPNQDQIIMVRYQCMPEAVGIFKADSSFIQKTTNVFNKLTADHSNQIQTEVLQLCLTDPLSIVTTAVEMCIQTEVLQLCLTDPLSIVTTAVEMCVRNEDQAISSAKVLQLLTRTCNCRHELYHSDMSLICSAVRQLVTSVKLSGKEEKNCLTFIAILIQSSSSGHPLMSPLEFLTATILPHTNMVDFQCLHPPINFSFALSLLQITLSASCNKSCDWSTSGLEPVVLVTILAQILNECVVLWDGVHAEDQSTEETAGDVIFSLPERVIMREKTSKCLNILCHMIETQQIVIHDQHLEWMLQETSHLHWSVQYRLVHIFEACGNTQIYSEYQGLVQECVAEIRDQLISVLLLVSLDGTLANSVEPACTLECTTVVSALTQVWPNLLQAELEHVVVFVERLFSNNWISVAYRLSSPVLLPLTALSAIELQQLLGLSQLLRDVILTLTLCCHSDDTKHTQMLRHVLQGFVAVIKERCERASQRDLHQFILSQMFVHVCDVTEHLPHAASELTWVLLLHMVTKVKAGCHSNIDKDGSHGNKVRDVTEIEPSIFEAVYKLPQCEERDMIIKKLRK